MPRHAAAKSLLAIAGMMFLAVGCQTARVNDPLTRTLAGNDVDAQMEFWHQLETRPITSNDEAFHGLLLYLDGEDPAADYAHRLDTLRTRGLLEPGFNQPGDQAVQRGALAVTVAKTLCIRGGLLMRLTGGNVERYALRELVAMNLYPPSSANQTFTGAEFLGIIGKLEDYQRGNPAEVPASVMPQQMGPATAPAQE